MDGKDPSGYLFWCVALLLANLVVGVMALVKLGEIADALN